MRRIRFFGQAVVTGVQWAKGVLDNVALLIAVAALTAGVTAGGILLHRPAWFLGAFGVALLLLVLGEGTYRTWERAAQQEQASRDATEVGNSPELTLVDQLRLSLKRGQGFSAQASDPFVVDPAMLPRAREWHDDTYRLLVKGGRADLARQWLDSTPAIPETPLSGASSAQFVLNQQVTSLKKLIETLRSVDAHDADARAKRLEALADEAIVIRDDEVPAEKWGTAKARTAEVFRHWQVRADAEVRRSAREYMAIWKENPANPMLLRFSTPDDAREFIDFNIAQLRHIATELRK